MEIYEIEIIISLPDTRGFDVTAIATVIIETENEQKAMNIAASYPHFKGFEI